MSYYVLIDSRTRRRCLKPKIVDSQATAATSNCQHDVHASLSLPQSSHNIRNITSSALVAQWIARWTSNPTVAGSSPVKSVSLGSVAQNMFDRACVCGSHAVSLGSRRVHRSHYQLICSSNLILKLDRSSIA